MITLGPVETIIIERLRTKPISPEDCGDLGITLGALRVHIHTLRKKKYDIVTDRIKRDRGRPGVYRLVKEPNEQT